MPRTAKPISAFAALALDLAPLDDGAMLLIPAGEFRARDGRPADVPAWRLTAQSAAAVIADRKATAADIVIDWEHATLFRAKKGEEAPAAGWINPRNLEWREDVGLVALKRDWTPRASAQIETGEYRYGSPVFKYDPITGDVQSLHSFALTNDPGLDGIAIALSALSPDQPTEDTSTMDELIERLQWLLNLPVGATVDDIKTQLQKIIDQLGTNPTAAASFDLGGHLAALAAQATAAPDPAKFVPVEAHRAVAGQLAALQAEQRDKAVDAAVTGALDTGKLLPAQEAWARELGKSNFAALTQFLETAQPIVALSGMQSNGQAPIATGSADLSADALAVCAQMGLSPEQFKKGVKP